MYHLLGISCLCRSTVIASHLATRDELLEYAVIVFLGGIVGFDRIVRLFDTHRRMMGVFQGNARLCMQAALALNLVTVGMWIVTIMYVMVTVVTR